MCQLGFLLAHTNETGNPFSQLPQCLLHNASYIPGNLISKELARYLLFRATALSGAELQHANLLVGYPITALQEFMNDNVLLIDGIVGPRES